MQGKNKIKGEYLLVSYSKLSVYYDGIRPFLNANVRAGEMF